MNQGHTSRAIPSLQQVNGVSIYNGDCADILPTLSIAPALILTSPPYDNLRDYGGHGFDFDRVADALVTVMPEGGVLVWVVADATIDGSETGSSFRQALGFMERGLKLHDTMIYLKKGNAGRTFERRHSSAFEYMFVCSRGMPTTVNLLKDRPNALAGQRKSGRTSHRNRDGSQADRSDYVIPTVGKRTNVWGISCWVSFWLWRPLFR